jgi:TfoX/Sxy family transcriptional regulator of competence genes
MATSRETIDHVLDTAGLGARLSAKKMFGEYGLYLDGTMVALVCDGALYLKPTPATASDTADLPLAPPYPNAKPHPQADALLDDPPRLHALLVATAAALPAPAKKPPVPR